MASEIYNIICTYAVKYRSLITEFTVGLCQFVAMYDSGKKLVDSEDDTQSQRSTQSLLQVLVNVQLNPLVNAQLHVLAMI